MKIRIAQTAGFCMGVRRAVDLAVDIATEGKRPVFTLGPLIHNTQTIEMLGERGVRTLGDDEPEPGSARILIRAHGIPPAVQHRYETRGHDIIDGTCPKVKTVHKVIQKYRAHGYDIVIAGDEGHAEVVGLLGYAGDAGHLIQTADDVAALPDMRKVCLVSQTTFDRETFEQIAERVTQRFADSEVAIKKTICSATNRRQEETRELAKTVDAMIIVGGKHSANTLRLAKISRESGTPTQHVETPEEIDWNGLEKCAAVGISAGASTPNWLIRRVAEHLQYLTETRRRTPRTFMWRAVNAAANVNVFSAAGAVALYYVSCIVQGFPFSRPAAVVSFLYFLSMYLWNSLVNVDLMRHLGLNRYQFYRAHRSSVWSLAVACIALLLWISFGLGRELFYFMVILTIIGSAYHFTIVPPFLRRVVRYKNLKDIPTSRDLFVALAWAVLLTFLPHATESRLTVGPLTILLFVYVFLLAYLRSVIFDLRDIEGDRIMGRETLVTIVGEKRARVTLHIALWVSLAAFVAFALLAVVPVYSWRDPRPLALFFQIPVAVYILIFMRLNRAIPMNRAALFNVLADALFYLAGFGAWAAWTLAELRGWAG